MKYHILLIPPEPVYSECNEVIRSLSQEYNSLLFHPHLTILSNVEKPLEEIKKAIETTVDGLDTLHLSLGPLSFSTTFYQSVFVRVNSIASLMNINLSLKKSFGLESSVFMPHISLLYGDHDMETREKIANEIIMTNSAFTANQVVIIPDSPDLVNWKPIATIPFGKEK